MQPTNGEKGIFAGKLHELERQREKTTARLCRYQQADHTQIRRELEVLWQEERESERVLRKSADTCRSPAVSALSRAQLAYLRRTRSILREELPAYLSGASSRPEEWVEAACLYGEYALDFAVQAMRHAQLAVLWATDLQMSCEERDAGRPEHNEEEPE